MLRVLAEEIGPPMFLTPTGKATLRLQEATGFEASTIHRWMYQPEVDKQSGVVRFDRKPLEKISRPSNHLIAVDEASMISEPIWTELLRVAALLKCNILLIGDPFQLPPVDPEARHPFCVLDDRFPADFKADLKEIVRQALDNPIIKASMYIRQGDMGAARALLPNLERMESWKLTLDICKKADGVVICHRNVTRHKINEGVRRDLKLPPAIQTGEPMLILKNCYEANVYNGEVLPFPGWTWESDKVEVTDRYRNLSATTRFGATSFNNTKVLLAHERIRGKMEDIGYGPVAYAASRTYYGKSTPEYPASRTNFRPFGKKKTSEPKHPFLDANFGYSLTCHKCQGSEFNRVLIIMEPTIRINEEEGLRWVYTAVTRAKEQAFLYWA
jgi:exodeoxyribonuclease-5